MPDTARIWWEGIRTGAGTLPREPVLGLKRLLLPVSYWRSAEFGYAWRQLTLHRGARILDLGSPKDLALALARSRGYEVVASDILDSAISLSDRYAAALGLRGEGPGRVKSEIQDGRSLTYADNSFDAAFSVSVLEHIPDNGDSLAIRELVRVVKPGGVVIITTPYDVAHRDTMVQREVYEREFDGQPVFFERHYDASTLKSRLLDASGARVINQEIWGEGPARGEKLLASVGKLRTLLSPIEAPLASLLLRRETGHNTIHPMAAFFTLQKPA